MTMNLARKLFLASTVALFATCRLPSMNFPPTPILNAYSQDNKELVINLDGNDPEGKQDISEYNFWVKDNDGRTVVEPTASGEPVVDRVVPVEKGVYYIYGSCTDRSGNVGETGPLAILIDPTVTFSISKSLGSAPLESLLTLSGENFTEYKIGVDENDNGEVEEDEVIKTSNPAIDNWKIILLTEGVRRIYGKFRNAEGLEGQVGPIEINVLPYETNPHLDGNVNVSSYNVGSKFTFSGRINSLAEGVRINNTSGDSISYRLIREIRAEVPGIARETFVKAISDNLDLLLHESGYLEIEQRNDDTLYFRILNAEIDTPSLHLIAGPLKPLEKFANNVAHIFEQSGRYNFQATIKYFKDGEQGLFSVVSEQLEVN